MILRWPLSKVIIVIFIITIIIIIIYFARKNRSASGYNLNETGYERLQISNSCRLKLVG